MSDRPGVRRGLRWAMCGAVLMAAIPSAAGAEGSASVVAIGWWTRNPVAAAPEGGFAVGTAPDGPMSVAAVRLDVGDGVDTLVLSSALSQGTAELVTAQVCLTVSDWSPTVAGAMAEAPTTTCGSVAVPFSRAGDGWRADVSSLLVGRSGAVDLAIVPVTGGSAAFDAAFARPAIAVTAAAPPATSPPSGPTPPASATQQPSSVGGEAQVVAPTSGTFSIDPAPSPTVSGDVVDAPDVVGAGPDVEVVPPGAEVELASPVADLAEAGTPRWSEALLLILISALVGLGIGGYSWLREVRA